MIEEKSLVTKKQPEPNEKLKKLQARLAERRSLLKAITLPDDFEKSVFCLDSFLCSIDHEPMETALIDNDGYSYGSKGIEKWLAKNNTNPNTRNHLTKDKLYKNRAIEDSITNQIELFKKQKKSNKELIKNLQEQIESLEKKIALFDEKKPSKKELEQENNKLSTQNEKLREENEYLLKQIKALQEKQQQEIKTEPKKNRPPPLHHQKKKLQNFVATVILTQ